MSIIINGPAETLTCKYCGNSYTSRGKKDPGYCKECERKMKGDTAPISGGDDVWRPIEGFDGYFVSRDGRIMGMKGVLKSVLPQNSTWRYLSVSLYKDGKQYRRTIHRLVAEAFIPNPFSFSIVNHKDENKLNNCADNLEWCSSKYNNTYGKNTQAGRDKVAMDRSKPVEMLENGRVVARYASIRDASRLTGINRHCISRVCNGTATKAGGYLWRFTNG